MVLASEGGWMLGGNQRGQAMHARALPGTKFDSVLTACGVDRANVGLWTDDRERVTCESCLRVIAEALGADVIHLPLSHERPDDTVCGLLAVAGVLTPGADPQQATCVECRTAPDMGPPPGASDHTFRYPDSAPVVIVWTRHGPLAITDGENLGGGMSINPLGGSLTRVERQVIALRLRAAADLVEVHPDDTPPLRV